MDTLNWVGEGKGEFAMKRPPDNIEIMHKVNEIVEWINSKKDQLL